MDGASAILFLLPPFCLYHCLFPTNQSYPTDAGMPLLKYQNVPAVFKPTVHIPLPNYTKLISRPLSNRPYYTCPFGIFHLSI